MKIFHLERNEGVGFDEVVEMIITSKNESDARNLASTKSGDEGAEMWKDASQVTCVEIGISTVQDAEPSIICRHYFGS